MRTFLTRLALVSMFLMSLLAAGSAAALADPGNGNGAVTSGLAFKGNICTDLGSGYTDCFVINGEQRITQTPSGNYLWEVYSSATDSLYYNGQVVKQETSPGHYVQVVTQNNYVVHDSGSDTLSYNGQTFCTAYRFHLTNGQVQFDYFGPC